MPFNNLEVQERDEERILVICGEKIMFRLTCAELASMNRSQIATGSQRHRDPRFMPFVFTGHGAIQAANVLNIPHAAETSVRVVRVFVRMREAKVSAAGKI